MTANAADNVIAIEELPTWNITEVPDYPATDPDLSSRKLHFSCRPELNEKLVIWNGDLSRLRTQAIVDAFNENLNPWIASKGGKHLESQMILERKQCRTGDARTFACYNVPCRFVIRVVAPRFNEKYLTAAESALYNCYRNALAHVLDDGLVTVAIQPFHMIKRGYPLDMGAHIALRTIRRFLEKYAHKIDRLMLHMPDETYQDIYSRLAPIYFPRNRSEEIHSMLQCPDDIGNEDGEPIHGDRPIRIMPHPHPLRKGSDSDNDEADIAGDGSARNSEVLVGTATSSASRVSSTPKRVSTLSIAPKKLDPEMDDPDILNPGRHAFAKMETDPDTRRLQDRSSILYRSSTGLDGNASAAVDTETFQRERRYQRLLRQAGLPQKAKDIATIAAMRVLYQCGTDVEGRPILLVVGKLLNWKSISCSQALAYFIHYMDRIVNNEFHVVYLQTMTSTSNQPATDVIRSIYDNVDDRYRTNLRGLYILHSSMWNRVLTWFLTTFTGPDVKNRVFQVGNISQLYRLINPRQLDLPEFVYQYEQKLTGKSSQEVAKPQQQNDTL